MYGNTKISVAELRRLLFLLEERCVSEEMDSLTVLNEIHAIIDDLVTEEKTRDYIR